jgi:ABC-type phosphate transport system substrate-binding protein
VWLGAVSIWAASLPGAEQVRFQLVVHPDVRIESLSRARVAEIFVKQRVRWDDGTRIVPVDQPIRSRLRAEFLKAVYDKEPAFMLRYWQRKIFSGRGVPPPELASDEEVIRFVARTAGAIGYVSPGAAAEGVRRIEVTR